MDYEFFARRSSVLLPGPSVVFIHHVQNDRYSRSKRHLWSHALLGKFLCYRFRGVLLEFKVDIEDTA
jgi:hypothetical protein